MSTSAPLPAELDIVIIGAGAAGIAAARRLSATGLSVGVLEARDRVGGRAHTLDHRLVAHRQGSVEVGLDMGCGWLHSADENILTEIGRQAGFTIDETPPPWNRPAFNLGLDKAEVTEFGAAFDAFDQRIAKAAAQGDDHAASTQFAPADDPDSRWNPRMDAVSGALNGARFAEVSTIDYDAYRDTGVNYRVREGYGRLIAALAQSLPVILDCPVTRIDRSGPRLIVQTPRGAVTCRAVILTVPTSLIGREAIRVDPPVPALVEAAQGAPLGLASKVHMTVETAGDFPADGQVWGRTDTAQTAGYHLRPFGRPMIEAY
ncbi:MAG: amine oxidase, partial [Brevundimonas sp.]|nr:amine oxidase [Brevundimonas sp.]